DGVMVLHTIGRVGPPTTTNAFIRRHIFPGGYIPALSEVMPHIEPSGLRVASVGIPRLHSAEALEAWRGRFMSKCEQGQATYDQRFCRMWDFYLAGSEASFRWQDLVNFQGQRTRRNDVLPMTRHYIGKCEKAIAMHEMGHSKAEPTATPPEKAAPAGRSGSRA